MEKPKFLVSWETSNNQDLCIKLIQTPFKPFQVISSLSQILIISVESQIFSLSSPSSSLSTLCNLSVKSLSCNSEVTLLTTTLGQVFIKGQDPRQTGILHLPGVWNLETFTEVKLEENPNFITCGLGQDHAVVLHEDGRIFTWGSNEYGQCGNNGGLVECSSYLKAVKLRCGKQATGFITSGGHLYTLGSIGRSDLCEKKIRKPQDPFILKELEFHYVKDFYFGSGFVVVLSEQGESFVYDDCRVLIKVPVSSFIKRICCNLEAVYTQERRSSVVLEWRFGKSSAGFECNLRSIFGKAYKIGKCEIFHSSSLVTFALVGEETAGKFLYDVNHELILTVPQKSSSPVHSPNTKRTSFGKLSKEFSLNIDNQVVIRNDSAAKIGEILKQVVKRTFKSLWESAFHKFIFKIATFKSAKIGLIWKIEKILKSILSYNFNLFRTTTSKNVEMKKILIDTFDEFAKNFKILKKMCSNIETCYKWQVLKKIKPKNEKFQAYIVRICVVSIVKVVIRIKSQIFTLLIREFLARGERRKSVCEGIDEYIQMQKSNKLMRLALVMQSCIEKFKTFNILKGLRAFKSTLRNMSCITSSITFMKPDRTFSETFDRNFNLNSYFQSNPQKSRGKKLSIEIPKLTKNLSETKPASTDRRHSMFLLGEKNEPKTSKDLRKAYDSKLKKSRKNSNKAADILKEFKKKDRINKISCSILKLESKFYKFLRRKKVKVFNSIIMAETERIVVIDQWKVQVFALGLHKFSLAVKRILKKIWIDVKS